MLINAVQINSFVFESTFIFYTEPLHMHPYKVLYDMPKVDGIEIRIYECGDSSNLDGMTGNELFDRTFKTKNSDKDVFYEVYKSGSNSPFYTSKTPPTNEEISFQLKQPQQADSMKIVIWVAIGFFVLYLFFR